MGDGLNRSPFVLASGASRSGDGDTLSFDYGMGSTYGPLGPGDEFRVLAIFTNATTFTERPALFANSDGAQGFGSSYAPVPEPASLATTAVCLLGLLCLLSIKSHRS